VEIKTSRTRLKLQRLSYKLKLNKSFESLPMPLSSATKKSVNGLIFREYLLLLSSRLILQMHSGVGSRSHLFLEFMTLRGIMTKVLLLRKDF